MDINGIKMVNFELRNYDPYLGRWMSADPYHQFYSPYLAMFNNPVSYIDPDGGWATSDGTDDYDDSGDNEPDNSLLMMVLGVFTTMSELGYFDETGSDGFTYYHWWLVAGGEMDFDTWIFSRFDAMTPEEYYFIYGDQAAVMLNDMTVYEDGKSTWRETWAEVQAYLDGVTGLDQVNQAVSYGVAQSATQTLNESQNWTIIDQSEIEPIGGHLYSGQLFIYENTIGELISKIDRATTICDNCAQLVPTIVPGKAGGVPLSRSIKTPKGWNTKPSKKGGGIIYQDPANPHNSIRTMPGNPKSPNPSQQNPYVVYKKNGTAYDVNGNPVSNANDPAAHIPMDQFDINKMPKFE